MYIVEMTTEFSTTWHYGPFPNRGAALAWAERKCGFPFKIIQLVPVVQ